MSKGTADKRRDALIGGLLVARDRGTLAGDVNAVLAQAFLSRARELERVDVPEHRVVAPTLDARCQ